jgi:alkaline phosphatase
MCQNLTDTLVIVTADHGHCNLEHYVLTDYPRLVSMLKRPVSIETRATSFHVKANAIRLLEYVKFPKDIIEDAKKSFL